MARFKNPIRMPRLAGALLCGIVAAAGVVRADGTTRLTVPSLQFNPCNGETVTGVVDALLGVQVNEDGTNVNVFREFHGTLTGNQGNTYKISSIAHDQFDRTWPLYYQVSFHNNVIGLGGAPNFEVDGTARIFVDADQNPIGYNASGLTFTCRAGNPD